MCPPQLRARLVMFQPLPDCVIAGLRAEREHAKGEGADSGAAGERPRKRKGFSLDLKTKSTPLDAPSARPADPKISCADACGEVTNHLYEREAAPAEVLTQIEFTHAGQRDVGPKAPKTKKLIDFSSALCPERTKHEPQVPVLARDLDYQPAFEICPPPSAVLNELGHAEVIMGVDLETAGWEEKRTKGSIGQFGHYNVCDANDLDARAVQIGWAVVDTAAGTAAMIKERLVQPDGFIITAKAAAFHGIGHEQAATHGLPLGEILSELMSDVKDVRARGGRIVAHHLEFDAGILDKELSRCGMEEARRDWGRAVRAGCCTMSPNIGRWLRTCFGEEAGPPSKQNVLKLRALATWFVPNSAKLSQQHHTAGADAELCARLYLEICKLAQSCAIPEVAAASKP